MPVCTSLPRSIKQRAEVVLQVRIPLHGRDSCCCSWLSVRVASMLSLAAAALLPATQVLTDRDELVTDAAAKLLGAWLAADCGGDPLALLQLLDVETYPGV